MSNEKVRFEHQPERVIVSIAPSISARDITRDMLRQDADRFGGAQPAQRALAKRLGVSVSTIRNVAGGRLKRVCVDFFARLKAEEMRRLSEAIAKAEHDLNVARQIGLHPDSVEFRALEAAVAAAKGTREAGR